MICLLEVDKGQGNWWTAALKHERTNEGGGYLFM